MNRVEKLINDLESQDIFVTLKDGENLNIDYGDSISDETIEQLRDRKNEVLEYLKSKEKFPIQKIELKNEYEISDHQRRIWILSNLYENGAAAYNVFGQETFDEKYNLEALLDAIHAVIDRHEILRTVFKLNKEGFPKQIVRGYKEIKIDIQTFDLKYNNRAEQRMDRIVFYDRYKKFDFENGPLFRVFIFEITDEKLILYFNIHHIICDAWSLGVLFKDILEHYEFFKYGLVAPIEPLPFQYKDFSAFQLKRMQSKRLIEMKDYWLSIFDGDIPTFELPPSYTRPPIKSFNGYRLEYNFSKIVTSRIKKFCRENSGTLFDGIVSLINILFYKYTGSLDVIIGTPITCRNLKQLEDQVGFYGNTLPVRTVFSDTDSFVSIFDNVKSTLMEANDNGDYPFVRLIEDLNIQRDENRNSLVNILVALQNELTGINQSKKVINSIERVIEVGDVRTRLDIDFSFEEVGEHLNMLIEYNPDLYEKDFIKDLIYNFRSLVENLLDEPLEQISKIAYLNSDDEALQLSKARGEDTSSEINGMNSIVQQFVKTCAHFPDMTALINVNNHITYRELNILTNKMAHFLKSIKGLENVDFIIIHLTDPFWIIVSEIAVLKLGKAFVPIDKDITARRLNDIKRLCNSEFVVNDESILTFKRDMWQINDDDLIYSISSNDLAYVIYTSGTSGNPKAVKIKHISVLSLVANNGFAELTPETIILSTASFSFDASIFEIYGSILNGGTLVLQSKQDLFNPARLKQNIDKYGVNSMWLTSGLLNRLIDSGIDVFDNLSLLICGGEALNASKIKLLITQFPQLTVINGYGPTENCTFSVTCNLNDCTFASNVPIGIPCNNTSVYILDKSLKMIPSGAIGEIYVGGLGLSSGYLGNEEKTASSFFDDPYISGEKIYKTGDLGRFRHDGLIEFIRRADDKQFKINGFRVEVDEIEEALTKTPGVAQAFVVGCSESGNTILKAYITLTNAKTENDIITSLKELIPTYMIPNEFVFLDEIFLTKSGKVDFKRLSLIDSLSQSHSHIGPRNEAEIWLHSIWQDVLKTERVISMDANFFEVGGNSINLIDLTSKMGARYDVTFSSLGSYVDSFTIEEIIKKVPLKKVL